MAATEQVTEWDAQGTPIPQSAATEWDAQGNPIQSSAAPSLSDNPNGEGLYQMKAPTGKTVGVPYSKVVDARNQGHSFADDNEQGRFNKDYSADPARTNEPGLSPAPTLGQRLKSALLHPLNSMESAAQPVSRPKDATIPEMVTTDLNNVAAAATGVARHPIKTAASMIAPVVKYTTPAGELGAMAQGQPFNPVKEAAKGAQDLYQQANENGPQVGTAMIGQGLAMGAGAEAVASAIPKLPGVKGWVEQHTPVAGENYTPMQHRALSGVLARGTGMGKDFFPKDVAETIASPVRQVVADHPELAKAIHEGTPEDSIGAFQKGLDLAKEKIDVAHQEALGPVRDTPFDMTPVQKAVTFPKSLEGFAPEDAEAIADLRTRLGNVKTLDGANELRMWLNRELAPEFRKNAAAGGRSGAVDSAMSSALSALRDPYYEGLEKASGQDFSGLKRTEGGIIKAQEAMGNVAPDLAKKQALATEPKTPKQMLADALKGGRTIHGGPITGTANLIAEKALGSTPLGDVQAGLQRVFANLPDKTAPPTVPNRPLQLPAPQGGTPFTIENPGHGAEPFPGSMAGVPSPEPVPATVTPAPAPTLQLPAVASPEGTVEPQQNPGTPPPPVNEATARMRVQPLPENPEPTPASPAGFTVGPDGIARREPAGALPAPAKATRAPRAAKPAMSHPAGDVTGIDEATGLPIVRRGTPAATSPSGDAAPEQRPAIQASANPDELRASAEQQKPVMQDMAEKAVEGVPGAKVEGMRVKDADSVENKADRGKAPETISDHLGARVSAPTPEGVEQVKQNVESQLPVAQADKITNNGLDADQYAVQTGKPGEPNQQSELQVVTKPQADAMKATDGLYDQQKEAEAKGDTAKAASLGDRIAQHFEKAKRSEGGKVQSVSPERGAGDKSTQPEKQTPAGVPTYEELVAKRANNPRNLMAPEVGSDEAFLRGGRIPVPGTPKEARALVDRIVRDRYKNAVDVFENLPQQIDGYRAVTVPNGIEDLKSSDLGRYWSDKESGAQPYHTNVKDGKTITLKATVDKGDLDPAHTIMARMRSATGHDESELNLRDGAKPLNVSYKLPGETEWKPLSDTPPAPAKGAASFSKGDRVTLPDGRPGTVQFYDGKITRNARVKLDDGSMVTSVKGADLKSAPQHVDTEPIGNPLPQRVQQIKSELAKGTDVRIFSARVANDPEGTVRAQIEDWAEKNLGRKVPVTNAKDDDMAFLLDDKANVTPNANEPFQIPAIPKGKWLGVDLDKTLAESETNAQPRISSGADANAKAEGGGDVPAQKEAAATAAGSNAGGTAPGKEAMGSGSGKQGAEEVKPLQRSWGDDRTARGYLKDRGAKEIDRNTFELPDGNRVHFEESYSGVSGRSGVKLVDGDAPKTELDNSSEGMKARAERMERDAERLNSPQLQKLAAELRKRIDGAASKEAQGAGTSWAETVRARSPIDGTEGKATNLLTPLQEVPAKYRLVEADDLKPSHNAQTFAKNPNYPEGVQERAYDTSKEAQSRVIEQAQKYDPRYTVNTNPDAVNGPPVITPNGTVLGGNSRAMSTQRLYAAGGENYRSFLKENASAYGFKPEQIDAMKKPVLVRQVEAPTTMDDARRLGSELNKSMTGAMGVSERAVSAGKNIKPETLRSVADMLNQDDSTLREMMSKRGGEVVKMLTRDGVITDRERPQFVDTATGGLSEEGKTFVERALMGSVIDDPRLMDAAPKSTLQKLERSLGSIASFASRADEWNLLPAIRQAVAEHGTIQSGGSSVEMHLGQRSLFGGERNPVVDALVRALDRKPNAVRDAFEEYARDADQNMPGQSRMFGEANAFDAFNHSFGGKLSEQEYHDGLEDAASKNPHSAAGQNAEGSEGLPRRPAGDTARSSESGSGPGLF